jgi:hypothetical protein
MTLLGLVTLGIVVPRRMIWYCSTPRECPGEIGSADLPGPGEQACVAPVRERLARGSK